LQERSRKGKPRYFNKLAAFFVQQATEGPDDQPAKNPAAVALGHLGGIKGGKARAKKLSPEQRREIAKKAAAARWHPT
jgi:hypothetical protein